MRTPHLYPGSGLAVVCDADGVVTEVIEAGLPTRHPVRTGVRLAEIVDVESCGKFDAFFTGLIERGTAFNDEINVALTDAIEALHFSGARSADGFLVLVAGTRTDLLAMVEEFLAMNNELVNMVRTLRKDEIADARTPSQGPYADFTRLNNELVNVQRELARRNADLERGRRLIQSILDTTPSVIHIYDLERRRTVYANRPLASLLGFAEEDRSDLGPDGIVDLLHPSAAEEFSGHLDIAVSLEDGQVREWEYRALDSLGAWRWLSTRYTVFQRLGDGRVSQILGATEDVTDRRNAQQRLEQLALVDELTGLYNRRGFDLFARQTVEQAARAGNPTGMLFADVDGLKALNDDFGHAAGDEAIRLTADALRRSTRAADVIGRLGGDEFAALVVETGPGGIDMLVSRLQQALADTPPIPGPGGEERPLAVSVGSARCDTPGECRLEELAEAADEAMYAVKRARKSDSR